MREIITLKDKNILFSSSKAMHDEIMTHIEVIEDTIRIEYGKVADNDYWKPYKKVIVTYFIDVNEGENGTYRVGLDLTAFSPEGGGQSWDKGTLDGLEVKGVYRENGEIVHVIDEPKEIGSTVVGEIDWEVRFRRMQEHSGEHLFCGILHNIHGYDNVGFHLSETGVTLDVDGPLSAEEIANIEKLANRAICEDIPIVASFPSPEEIKDIDYRSKLELDSVRLVTIEGIDICACCAPHVASTGQIGVIKVIDFMPHRGGTRIMLKSGTDAYEDFVALAESTKAVMGYLSAKRYECAEAVERAMNAQLKLKEENTELKKAELITNQNDWRFSNCG